MTASYYSVQLFDAKGRELQRLKRDPESNLLQPYHLERRVWREAYSRTSTAIAQLTRRHIGDSPHDIHRELHKSGISISESFAEELAQHIRHGDPMDYLSLSFLTPHWIVKRDRNAEKIFPDRRWIAMGMPGERVLHFYNGILL